MLALLRSYGLENTAKFRVTVDREKASSMGISAATIDQAFAIAWGSSYVNNFLDSDNRVKRVFVQGDAKWRMSPENLNDWYLRNAAGEMVPFSAFGTSSWTYGSPRLERYNGMPSIRIQGVAAPGYSTGEAMTAMEEIVRTLPEGIGSEWTGMSLQEKLSGSQAPILYLVSVIFVFLCLAALYESWAIPTSVILVVPVGVCGALIAALVRGLENDVFFQVALLTTVGLCAKNSILIVEFARHLVEQGKKPFDAAVEAAALRLRPILMTSMAFVLGITPLMFSRGAGAASQNSIGTSLIGGMMSSTILAIFLTPLFFYGVCLLIARVTRRKPQADDSNVLPPMTATLDAPS
jgi:multidrug efflux pump